MNPLGLNKQDTKFVLRAICGDATPEEGEAWVLKIEQAIIDDATPPADIRSIPLEERHNYDNTDVAVPDHVKEHLAKCVFPLSTDETSIIEEMMEEYHKVSEPNCIGMNFGKTGKPYTYLPEVANYATGFLYFHEELKQPRIKIPRHSKHSKN